MIKVLLRSNIFPVYGRAYLLPPARRPVYLDSGASLSIFSIEDAIRIGIDYLKGKEVYLTVGDGGGIPVYLHRLPIKLVNTTFEAAIGFSPRLGVGFNLIGRKSFFEKFDIIFSDTSQTITFLYPP